MDIIEIHANSLIIQNHKTINYNDCFIDYSDHRPRFGDEAKNFIKDCICDYFDDMLVLKELQKSKN